MKTKTTLPNVAPDFPEIGEVIDAFYFGLSVGIASTAGMFALMWWAL